jgi:hypothetical protein
MGEAIGWRERSTSVGCEDWRYLRDDHESADVPYDE